MVFPSQASGYVSNVGQYCTPPSRRKKRPTRCTLYGMYAPRMHVYPPGYGHSPLSSDYRPWETDLAFLEAWRRVRKNTLVDQARLYELWELVEQVSALPGAILEVGAWRGGSAALMALRLRNLGVVKELFVADTFSGVVKAGSADAYYIGGEHGNTSLDILEAFFHDLALQSYHLLAGVFPEETAHRIEGETVALCHIDVDVYQSAADTFAWVWPRLARGGVCVFDDYGFLGCEGVARFVDEIRPRTDSVVVGNLNGHAVVVKTQ